MEQPGIWKMSLNGGEEVRVLDQPEGFRWYNWALMPGGIYLLNDSGAQKPRIEFFDFATHRSILIQVIERPGIGVALAPDGKSLLYHRFESEDYEIMLVKNFH